MKKIKKASVATATVLTAVSTIAMPGVLSVHAAGESEEVNYTGQEMETVQEQAASYSDAKEAFYQAKDQLAVAKGEYETAENERNGLIDSENTAKANIRNSDTLISEKRQALQDALAEAVKAAVDQETATKAGLENAKNELDRARQEVTVAERNVDKAEEALRSLQNGNGGEEQKAEAITNAELVLANASSELDALKNELNDIKEKYEDAAERYQKSIEEKHRLLEEAAAAQALVDNSTDPKDMQATVDQAKAKMETDAAIVAERESAVSAAQDELTAAENIDPQIAQNEVIGNAENALVKAQADKAQAEEGLNEARGKEAAARTALNNAETEYSGAQELGISLKQEAIAEAESNLADKVAAYNQAKQEYDDAVSNYNNASAEKAGYLAAAEAAQAIVAQKAAELQAKTAEINTKTAEIRNKETALAEAEATVSQKKAAMDAAQAALDDIIANVPDIEYPESAEYQALEDAKTELERIKADYNNLSAELEEARAEYNTTKAAYDAAVAEIDALTASKNQHKDNYNALNAQMLEAARIADEYFNAHTLDNWTLPTQEETDEYNRLENIANTLSDQANAEQQAYLNDASELDSKTGHLPIIRYAYNEATAWVSEVEDDLLPEVEALLQAAEQDVQDKAAAYNAYKAEQSNNSTAHKNAADALQTASEEYAAAQARKIEINDELAILREELNTLESEAAAFREQIDSAQAVVDENMRKANAIDEDSLQTIVNEKKTAADSLKEEVDSSTAALEEVQNKEPDAFVSSELDAALKAKQEAEALLAQANSDVSAKEAVLSERTALVQQAEQALEEARSSTATGDELKAKAIENATANLNAAQANLNEAKAALQISADAYQQLEEEFNTAKTSYAALVNDAAAKRARADAYNVPTEEFNNLTDAYNAQIASLDNDISRKQEEVQQAEEQLDTIRNTDAAAFLQIVVEEAQKELEKQRVALLQKQNQADQKQTDYEQWEKQKGEAEEAVKAAKELTVDGAIAANDKTAYLGEFAETLLAPTEDLTNAIAGKEDYVRELDKIQSALQTSKNKFDEASERYKKALGQYSSATADLMAFIETLGMEPNYSWIKGGSEDLCITINGMFDEFVGLFMDGQQIDTGNYSVSEGSTIITLKPEYLNTLSVGTHALTAEYGDVYADLSLDKTVKANLVVASVNEASEKANEASQGSKDVQPQITAGHPEDAKRVKTGDTSDIGLFTGLGVSSAITAGAMLAILKRKKRSR